MLERTDFLMIFFLTMTYSGKYRISVSDGETLSTKTVKLRGILNLKNAINTYF